MQKARTVFALAAAIALGAPAAAHAATIPVQQLNGDFAASNSTVIKTPDGVVSMTLCNDKAGADEANRVETTWLKDKLPTFTNRAPDISTGEVRFQLEGDLVKVPV